MKSIRVDIITYRTGDLLLMLRDEQIRHHSHDCFYRSLFKERYDVSDSLFLAGPVLVVPVSSQIATIEDLKVKRSASANFRRSVFA